MGWEAGGLQVFPGDPTNNPMTETQFIIIAGDRSQQKVCNMLMLRQTGGKIAVCHEQIELCCCAS